MTDLGLCITIFTIFSNLWPKMRSKSSKVAVRFPGGDDEIVAEALCATMNTQDEDVDEAEEEGEDEGL